MDVQPVLCAICKTSVDTDTPSSILTAKGSSTINRVSTARSNSIYVKPGDVVQQECRRKYCNPHQIAKDINQEEPTPSRSSIARPVLRSSEDGFSFKTDCFFCGRTAKVGKKRKYDVLEVKTIGIKETILKICEERADSWSDVVKARILHVHDLHAADAIYHQTCSVNFRTKKQMPIAQFAAEDIKKPKLGRPQDDKRIKAFLKVASYLEDNDDEQITINDLVDLMDEKLANNDYDAYR